jgi:hypothetical protein
MVSPDASHAGAPLLSTTHGAGKDGRCPWRRGGHLAGRTVKSANKRVPVRYHGMDYFSGLFEHRATKCRVNRRGKTGPMKSHGRQVQVLLQISPHCVVARTPLRRPPLRAQCAWCRMGTGILASRLNQECQSVFVASKKITSVSPTGF